MQVAAFQGAVNQAEDRRNTLVEAHVHARRGVGRNPVRAGADVNVGNGGDDVESLVANAAFHDIPGDGAEYFVNDLAPDGIFAFACTKPAYLIVERVDDSVGLIFAIMHVQLIAGNPLCLFEWVEAKLFELSLVVHG